MSLKRAETADGVQCVDLVGTVFRHILLPSENHENIVFPGMAVTIIVLFHDLIVYAFIWELVSI